MEQDNPSKAGSPGTLEHRVSLQSIGTVGKALDIVILKAGVANKLLFAESLLRGCAERFNRAPCFIDHASLNDLFRSGGRSVRDLAGLITDARWDPGRSSVVGRLALTQQNAWLRQLIAEFGDHSNLFGLSAVLWLTKEGQRVTDIKSVESVDIVCHPAAGGRFLEFARQLTSRPRVRGTRGCREGGTISREPLKGGATRQGETLVRPERKDMSDESTIHRVQTAQDPQCDPPGSASAQHAAPVSAPNEGKGPPVVDAPLREIMSEMLALSLSQSNLPPNLQAMVKRTYAETGSLATAKRQLEALKDEWAIACAQTSIKGLGQIVSMRAPQDQIELAFMKLMGLEIPSDAQPARLSGIREMYDLLTGDWDRHGLFYADRVQFANATSTTMAEVVRNVLNKAMLRAFEMRPQWWKPVVHEEDFYSLQQIRWITLGGFSDLDTVAEGDAYTEKTWDDHSETSDFLKKGNYIGLTMEMIDKDDVGAVRAIPRKLGLAANRTLAAAVAALFTSSSGTGPTLSDGNHLFDAGNHGNLGTTALSANEWDAVI
jgi:hypothetical protein